MGPGKPRRARTPATRRLAPVVGDSGTHRRRLGAGGAGCTCIRPDALSCLREEVVEVVAMTDGQTESQTFGAHRDHRTPPSTAKRWLKSVRRNHRPGDVWPDAARHPERPRTVWLRWSVCHQRDRLGGPTWPGRTGKRYGKRGTRITSTTTWPILLPNWNDFRDALKYDRAPVRNGPRTAFVATKHHRCRHRICQDRQGG